MSAKSKGAAIGFYEQLSCHGVPLALLNTPANALIGAHVRLFKQVEMIDRAWQERVALTRKAEVALGYSLLECHDPTSAISLCGEWMRRQAMDFASDMLAFAETLLEFSSHFDRNGKPLPTSEGEVGAYAHANVGSRIRMG